MQSNHTWKSLDGAARPPDVRGSDADKTGWHGKECQIADMRGNAFETTVLGSLDPPASGSEVVAIMKDFHMRSPGPGAREALAKTHGLRLHLHLQPRFG